MHGEVLAFDPAVVTEERLAQDNTVAVALAFRPSGSIRIGSQVGCFSNGVRGQLYGEVLGNIAATSDLRKAGAMAMQQAARVRFELPSGYAGDIYHHNGGRDPEVFASDRLVQRLREFDSGRHVAFLALADNPRFEPFRPEEFGGSLYTSAQGIAGIDIYNVYGLTTNDIAGLLGPRGFDGLTDGILDPRLWPTYRLLNVRLDELPS